MDANNGALSFKIIDDLGLRVNSIINSIPLGVIS
jgi:hypothetical protein